MTPPLTHHELTLAALLADTDLTAQQIGTRVGIAGNSVNAAAGRIYRKLDVRNRAGLRDLMLELELAAVGAP